MFKRKITSLILSLFTLSSCVTMDGGKNRNKIRKPDRETTPKQRDGVDSKLSSLSNLRKLGYKTEQENDAILSGILKPLSNNGTDKSNPKGKGGNKEKSNSKGIGGRNKHKTEPKSKDNKKEINSNYRENLEFAKKVLKGGVDNLENLKTNVDNFVKEYDETDAFFLDHSFKIVSEKKSFKSAQTNLDIIKRYYLDKTQADVGGKGDYIKYLQDKVSKTDMSKKTFPDSKTKPDEYIAKVEEAYKEQYKKFGIAGDDLNTLRGNLQNKITEAENKLEDAKRKILAEYKKIDPSYTANELPLAIDELIEKYKGDRKKIIELLIANKEKLKGLKSLADVTNPEYKVTTYGGVLVTEMGDDYIIKMGDREFKAKDFSLDNSRGSSSKGRGNQKEIGKDKDNGGKGKKPEQNNPSFYKAERQISSETKTFGTFMPGIKTELNKYGNDETEQDRRKKVIRDLLSDFESGKGDKDKIKNLLTANGNDIGIKDWKDNYNDWSAEDKKKLNLLKDMLKQQTKPDFDIKVTENKKDIVKLGGKLAGLTFSDFGMWEVQTLSTYSGDTSLMKGLCKGNNKDKNCKPVLPLSEQQSEFNAFATGADKFKRKFAAGGEGTTKWTGKTIAGVSLFGDNGLKKSKTFDGTATLDITNNTGKGDFSFDYQNWYNFKFKNIDLTDPNGYSTNDHDVEVGGKGEKDFHFDLKTNEKLKGKLKGALYGAEVDKPTEGSGVFNIETDKVDSKTYKTMKIDGAFGMTIPGTKTDRPEKGKGKGRKK